MKPAPGYLTIKGDDTPVYREGCAGWLTAITIGIVLPLICVAAVGIQKRALQEQTLHDLPDGWAYPIAPETSAGALVSAGQKHGPHEQAVTYETNGKSPAHPTNAAESVPAAAVGALPQMNEGGYR